MAHQVWSFCRRRLAEPRRDRRLEALVLVAAAAWCQVVVVGVAQMQRDGAAAPVTVALAQNRSQLN